MAEDPEKPAKPGKPANPGNPPAARPSASPERRADPGRTPLERLRANFAALEPPARLPGIDVARGLAVIGMYAAHLAVIAPLVWGRSETWSGLVSGRSSILFATLAGVSLAIAAAAARRRSGSGPARWWGLRTQLALRAALIWLLGITLDDLDVPVYVILPAYGVLFLIGIPLLRLPTSGLFALAALLAVSMPVAVAAIDRAVAERPDGAAIEETLRLFGWNYPFLLWAAFIAAGIGAGRVLLTSPRRAWALLVSGAALAGLGYGIVGPIGDRAVRSGALEAPAGSGPWLIAVLQDAPHSSGVGEAVGSGGFALAVIGACALIGATPLRLLLWPLRALGSMPLTAYVAHILIWAAWIAVGTARDPALDPWFDFRALDPFWPMTLGALLGCSLWAALLGRGPMERLLGLLTRGPTRRERVGRPDAG